MRLYFCQLKDADVIGAIVMCNKLTSLGHGFKRAPGSNLFPGHTKGYKSRLECSEITINSHTNEAHATGYYLPANQEMTVIVVEDDITDSTLRSGDAAVAKDPWSVRIGAHSDVLYNCSTLRRWPDIVVTKKIMEQEMKVKSAFGGLVYLVSPRGQMSITVRLVDVIEAPFYNMADEANRGNWHIRRHAKAPWADIQGRYIRFTLPTRCLQVVGDLEEVMTLWDKVMEAYHDLRGSDVTRARREWVVRDVQISLGFMHSGYPIMGYLKLSLSDSNELNVKMLKERGFWGTFHELGHNMQRRWWTLEGTREVTCNIFSLLAQEVACGVKVGTNPKIFGEDRLRDYGAYLSSDVNYSENPNAMVGLGFYAHLLLTFGWEAFRAVFHEYEATPDSERPRDNQAKVDQWLLRFSRQVNASIAPIMRLWKLGASEEGEARVAHLDPVMPDDVITRLVPGKLEAIRKSFSKL